MHSQLESYIAQYWGKAWTLQLLHDHYPQLRKHLAPARIIAHRATVSQKVYKALIDSRRSFGSPDILARASHPKDRFGLVDFLPTITLPDPERERRSGFLHDNRQSFQDVLDHRTENSFSAHNKNYAEELHYLLTPYIKHTLYTITEHPNQHDHFFVDTGSMWTFYWRRITDVVWDQIIWIDWHPDTQAIKKTLSLVQLLRKLNIFKEDDKLQYEIAIAQDGLPYIFQVRKFADMFATLPKDILANHRIMHHSRAMGTLQPDQALYHRHGSNLDEMEIAIDYASWDNLLFSCDLCSDHITFAQSPPNLKWFICESQSALFHNLTAPSQAVLQNNGFAFLNMTPPRYDEYIKMSISWQGIQRSKTNPKKQKH